MIEKDIEVKVIAIIDNMDIIAKFGMYHDYMLDTIIRGYEFKVGDKPDGYLEYKHYPVLGLYVGKYPSDSNYKVKPMSFPEFISADMKKKESYVTGDFYHLGGIYHYFKKKVEQEEAERAKMIKAHIYFYNFIKRKILECTGIPNL